jgi:hypothetical protein
MALLVHKVIHILEGQLTTNATKDGWRRVPLPGFGGLIGNHREERMRGKRGL